MERPTIKGDSPVYVMISSIKLSRVANEIAA